jgi:hypothetical protein
MHKLVQVCVLLHICLRFTNPSTVDAQETKKTRFEVAKDGVTIAVRLPSKALAGKPFEILMEIHNRRKETIRFDCDIAKCVAMSIVTSDGIAVPKTRLAKNLEDRNDGFHSAVLLLAPEKKASVKFDLGLLYDLSVGGHYSATVEFKYSIYGMTLLSVTLEKLKFYVPSSSLPGFQASAP